MRSLLFVFLCLVSSGLLAQCSGGISTFPHTESFEASNGNWVTGGQSSDWVWGTPSKTLIKGAGGGQRCWIAGDLTAQSYNAAENSWVLSPCYDFSSLTTPMVSFSVFWETERRWDGASLQYSTDNGTTWVKAGSVADTADCYTSNWFNYATINNVGDGWSGTIKSSSGGCVGGGGIGQWVQTRHQFLNLAGKPSVRFRFTFNSGTTCNDYDGFAFDNFTVMNTPAFFSDFTFTCQPNKAVVFTNMSFICPRNYQWDFGDPSSGVSNSSNAPNPQHTFSSPGTFNVTLTSISSSGSVFFTSKPVTILGAAASIISPVKCHDGVNGSIKVVGTGSSAPYTFTWNTNPANYGMVLNNLAAGVYTAYVTSGNACPATASVSLSNPTALVHTVDIIDASCNGANGSATIREAGGSPPYTYNWIPTGGTTAAARNLRQGSYTAYVKDNRQCGDTIPVVIQNFDGLLMSLNTLKNSTCYGADDGRISVKVSRGTPPYIFRWNPNVGSTADITGLKPGVYTITAEDSGGCKGAIIATITQPAKLAVSLGRDTVLCPGSPLLLSLKGFKYYLWQDGSTAPTFSVKDEGSYYVQVTSSLGCTASDTMRVRYECNDIVFPSAFTPNGDGKNDVFRPIGTLSEVSLYTLSVYNRWGQLVFRTSNPYQAWDGKLKSSVLTTGTYIWTARYSFNKSLATSVKGTVTLIR